MSAPLVDPIVGIDLGTTNSLVAFSDERGPRVLVDASGRALLPSVVGFSKDDAPRVGVTALESPVIVSSAKRFMGRSAEESKAAARELGLVLTTGPRGLAAFDVGDRAVTPQEIAALVLSELRRMAEAELGTPVRRAVITVPAYFDDAQRQATRDAGRLAGLEVERMVNEPTAAALAYGLGRGRNETVAVYDLGGGTFDISILRIEAGAGAARDSAPSGSAEQPSDPAPTSGNLFEVLATAGDTRLGGDDLDAQLEALVAGSRVIPQSQRRVWRQEAERVKRILSTEERTLFRIEDAASAGGASEKSEARAFERVVERGELEAIAEPLLARTAACCRRALADAGQPRIDRAILVGGMTRMPAVRKLAAEIFGIEPYVALDPDQVVALGAAVHAASLGGRRRDLLLLDVIPLSLGIETVGGAVAKLLVRNSTIPTRAVERFSTSVDHQTSVKIHVLQGERELVADCRSIARFDLRGIPPMPAGIPKIEVEFLVDENGVLSVSAVERRSGRRAGVQVVPSCGLTADEVELMDRESVLHAREDMNRHRLIDLAVNARLDLKWIGEALARVRNQLEATYVASLEALMVELTRMAESVERKEWQSIDADAFHAAKEALDRASIRMHEAAITESLRGTSAEGS